MEKTNYFHNYFNSIIDKYNRQTGCFPESININPSHKHELEAQIWNIKDPIKIENPKYRGIPIVWDLKVIEGFVLLYPLRIQMDRECMGITSSPDASGTINIDRSI